MKVQLTIDGSFEELQEVFRLLSGTYKEATLEEISVPGCTIEEILPNVCLEKIKATAETGTVWLDEDLQSLKPESAICLVCNKSFIKKFSTHKFCTPKCYQKKYYQDLKKAINPVKEKKSEITEKHCHQCGKLFTPKRAKTNFCSKKCYMIEWREVRQKPTESPTANIAEPEAAANPVKEPKPGRATVKVCNSKFKKEKKPLVKDDFGGLY